MNNGIIELQLGQFLLVYLLLLVVVFIMKKCKIDQSKLLVFAGLKMTVQLVLAGLILSYIFRSSSPIWTVLYIGAMMTFAICHVLRQNKDMNRKFKLVTILSMALSGISVIVFFVYVIVGESIFNPQYMIPIAGMVMGNTMTGVGLGIKSFRESLAGQRARINALFCMGASPSSVLMPFVKQSLETAMMPTINSMVGMGIVSLPGMMTGQILAGTMPMTAILYQIAMMIAICTVVTLACFGTLYFGHKTLYDKHDMILKEF